MARRILIFSIAIGAEYLSYMKSIATFALTFFGYVILVLASVLLFQVQFTKDQIPRDYFITTLCMTISTKPKVHVKNN